MRQNRVHLMPPMSNFYARICVKATPSSNTVLLESADLKSSFDKRTLFLRIPTISVGANVDTTNGIFAGHKRPGFTR